MIYLILAFACSGIGFAWILSRKHLPGAVGLFIVAALLFVAALTGQK